MGGAVVETAAAMMKQRNTTGEASRVREVRG